MNHIHNNGKSHPHDIDRIASVILKATQKKAKSAVELSKRYGIPIAKCFKKIKYLQQSGYIRETKKVSTKEGKEVSLYKADQDMDLLSSTNSRSKAQT